MMNLMLLAYIDETGDTGNPELSGSTSCYALGCVLIDADNWSLALDRSIAMRRYFRDQYKIPVRKELKANYLIRSSGTLRGLEIPEHLRKNIYRLHLRNAESFKARAFGVVIDKESTGKTGQECFDLAWHTLLQRLETTCRYDQQENQKIMVFHDNGENDAVRKIVRRSQKFLPAGSLVGQNRVLQLPSIDDAVPRSSDQSYLIQLADLVAYSAWRTYRKPSATVARVVPQSTWNQLGPAIHTPVNKQKPNGSVPGVVLIK